MSDADRELLETFYEETRENLETCEEALLELEKDPSNTELIDSVFRAMHTIKGGSGLVSADAVQALSHELENILSDFRDQSSKIDENTLSLLLSGTELISKMLNSGSLELENNQYKIELENLLEKVKNLDYGNNTEENDGSTKKIDEQTNGQDFDGKHYYLVKMDFHQDIFETGTDPLMFFHDIQEYGKILCSYVNDSKLPSDLEEFENFDPQKMYLDWTVILESKSERHEIEDIFLFVIDDNNIIVEDITDELYLWMNDREFIKNKFHQYQVVSESQVPWAVEKQLQLADSHDMKFEQISSQSKDEQQLDGDKEETKSQQSEDKSKVVPGQDTVRVNTSKLEGILNYIAELLIAQSRVKELVTQMADGDTSLYDEVFNSFQEVDKIVRQVQDEVLEASMVPIGSTLIRFQKMARDIAQEKNKRVEVNISGKETELDKKVIEKISDPLKHLIRNSLDHGLEDPDEREQKGKPRTGKLEISAYHQEGNIVIKLSDDGAGIDHEKVLAKAVEKGLASQDIEYSRDEITDMLFMAGFSTASQVSDISGRGVGLDVVKNNIKSLRGSIDVDSEPGKGTSFTIKLPLTLAIIDGMMVRMGEERFIIPITFISEFIKPKTQDFSKAENKSYVLNLRDEYIPYARLDKLVDIGEGSKRKDTLDEGICIILHSDRRKLALMVDEIIGQEQVVIKSLRENLAQVEGIAGVTILGDGRVSIILDVPSLFKMLRRNTNKIEGSNAM